MSTDPTANPDPDAGGAQRPSDWTTPPAGWSQQPPPPPPAPGTTPPPYGAGQQSFPAPPPAPAYGGGDLYAGSAEHPKGTMVLILGILSIVICQFLGPFAWVMGRRALTEIDTSGRTYSNRGVVQAGMICGIIGTVLLVLGLIYVVFVLGVLGLAGTSGQLR